MDQVCPHRPPICSHIFQIIKRVVNILALGKGATGRGGKDLVVEVPCGTIVRKVEKV